MFALVRAGTVFHHAVSPIIWLREPESNRRNAVYETAVLPLNYPAMGVSTIGDSACKSMGGCAGSASAASTRPPRKSLLPTGALAQRVPVAAPEDFDALI